MFDYRQLEERCQRDPMFRGMVDLLESQIERLNLTPLEVREAAMFACVRFEMRHTKQFIVARGTLDTEQLAEMIRNGPGRIVPLSDGEI